HGTTSNVANARKGIVVRVYLKEREIEPTMIQMCSQFATRGSQCCQNNGSKSIFVVEHLLHGANFQMCFVWSKAYDIEQPMVLTWCQDWG
ncbi:MAG: hypothetical protein ABJL35_00035, partial [Parasphingorhabdus sp.]|uniref:hypothetical protein n=1 Tax=Parasphingorhabdus sp. TaxID=2709688 RepID=UPI0032980176